MANLYNNGGNTLVLPEGREIAVGAIVELTPDDRKNVVIKGWLKDGTIGPKVAPAKPDPSTEAELAEALADLEKTKAELAETAKKLEAAEAEMADAKNSGDAKTQGK